MSKENRDRTVQLLAVNPKYKERACFLVPIYNSTTRRYEVGIEDIPVIEQGKILKALGISDDPKNGVQLDELQIPISHRQKLNLANTEDYGIYCLALVNTETVAPSRKQVDSRKHLFCILDVEKESVEDVSLAKLQHEAVDRIFKEGDLVKLKSLCIYLGGIDVANLSLNALTAKAIKVANEKPQDVIAFYEGKGDNKLMILELYHYGVIQFKQGKYYDGEIFMGTLEEAIDYIANPKNSQHVNSLGTRLLEKKG